MTLDRERCIEVSRIETDIKARISPMSVLRYLRGKGWVADSSQEAAESDWDQVLHFKNRKNLFVSLPLSARVTGSSLMVDVLMKKLSDSECRYVENILC